MSPAAAPAKPKAAQPAAPAPNAEPPASLVLDDLVAPLRAGPEDGRAAGAQALVDFADLMKRVQAGLLTRDPQKEEVADQDRLLLTYLAAYFKGICATPNIINGDMMEHAIAASGLALPFAGPSGAGGAAQFGVPTNVTPDVLCDSASELARMAAAALLALFVYLNFKRGPNDLPSDEAVLVFATIAINSTANAANAEAVDKQIGELGAPGGISCAQIRWLMHFVRQMVMNQMGAVCHLLGNKTRHAECVVAAQHDHRAMVRALPDHALGYSLWARSAMGLQQAGVAAAVLARGLEAARAARDDAWEAAMCYQLAVAKILGGGAAAAPAGGAAGAGGAAAAAAAGEGAAEAAEGAAEEAAPAPPRLFDASEILALRAAGDAAAASVEAWWPAAWAESRPAGEPDRGVLTEKLIPMAEERSGLRVAEGEKLPVLDNVLYVTRAPSTVPPGAMDALGVGPGAAGGGSGGGGGGGAGVEGEAEAGAEPGAEAAAKPSV
ncbi:hypothetical protein Rsub_06654 [Raphidocelis subcapitata]|uniref:Uncharacterized protein n=1 Tax=Raphidocelis subcapitata TaxID=307507 RepID=A0A2V0P0W9_9CHLO|nr:hypothetical protein Rsub_06654 [Raphidocelis subcapitata]|eukprot:GBF93521.1 hypothetical protein Rsub_06654 [Raphidocelis subcapitata]